MGPSKFAYLAKYVVQRQLPNGLWSCYMDEPSIAEDTSGSAGIAAALAFGASAGYLPPYYMERAKSCYRSLLNHIDSDGFLRGCSQSNKGGEGLQRSTYRVVLPYALGLLGLLHASLQENSCNQVLTSTAT